MNITFIQFRLKLLLLALILLGFSEVKSQQIITIGTGTTLEDIPAQGNENYGWNAIVYPSWNMLGQTGYITEIAFDVGVVQDNASASMVNQKIYIKEVSYSNFINTSYINPTTIGATLVYDGNIQWNNIGWNTITLDQDYNYNGGHLLVLYENHGGGNTANFYDLRFNTTNLPAPNRCKKKDDWPWFPTSSGYYYSQIPNMQLTIIPIVPNNIAADEWILPYGDIDTTSNSTIKVRVKNKGSISQDSIVIRYSMDNGNTYIWDTIYNSILPFDTFTHTFSTTANLSKMGRYDCLFIVQNQGDTIGLDDSLFYNELWVGSPLSGTYTIGSNAQNDFSELSDAINTLKHFGMSSSVVLELDTGVFTGIIELDYSINGLNTSDTLIIKGKGENTIITASSLNANRSVFLLNNNNNVTIDSLSIIADHYYANHSALKITNSNNIVIKNSAISIHPHSDGTTNGIFVSDCNYIELNNNEINRGVNSINVIGNTSVYHGTTTNLKILNNRITGFKSNGISAKYQDDVIYENNYIETSDLQLDACLRIENNTGGRVHKNTIISNSKRGIGVKITDCAGSALESFSVLNNMISLTNASGFAYGIYMTNGEYVHYYNNSILIGENSGEYSKCFYAGSYSSVSSIGMHNNKIINNIIMNSGGGYAMRVYYNGSGPNFFSEVNYNNIYTSSSNYVVYGGNYNNIASWKTNGYGFALNSISIDPLFISNKDLHSRSALANDSGLFVLEIVDDIDGDLRNNSLHSDIGADEYTPFVHEMELLKWQSPTTGVTPSATIPISILVANYGTQSQSNIPVKYSIDNGVTYVEDTILGPILPYDSELFTFSVQASMISDTIYQCKAIVNLSLDQNHNNDTISYKVYFGLPLAGAYTLGSATNSDFASFANLEFALSSCGISAPVVIYLDSGLYNESISFGKVDGCSSNNTITIKGKGSDKTTLINTHLTNQLRSVIGFNNAHFYIIDSLKISGNNSIGLVHGIYLEKNNSNIEITNCIFDSGDNNLGSFIGIKSFMTDKCCWDYYQTRNSDSLLIKNNTFIGGEYGIFLYSNFSEYIYSIANKVVDNTFINQINAAVYAKNQKSLSIISNTINNDLLSNSNYKGLSLADIGNTISIKRNRININGSCGIYINDYYQNISGGSFQVYNNFIIVHNNYANYSQEVYGIQGKYMGVTNFNNNTVKVDGLLSNTACVFSLYDAVGNSMVLKNNIFVNEIDGPVISIGTHYPSNLHNNNNNLISNSGVYVVNGMTSYNLSDWKTASSAPNTVSIDPEFYSDNNLHVNSMAMSNLGVSISGITEDIDGELRSTSPDIGADEYVHQSVSIGGPYTLCEGDSLIVNSSIGSSYNYLWTFNGDTLLSNESSVIIDTAGVLTVEILGSSSDYDTTNINIVPYPEVNLGSDTIVKMITGGIVLNVGNPDASVLWSTGDTTHSMSFSSANLQLGDNEVSVDVSKYTCSTQDTIILTLIDDTSIDNLIDNNEVILSPNPNKGIFNLAIENVYGNIDISIIDISGKIVFRKKYNSNGVFDETIDISRFSKGIFVLKIENDGRTNLQKLIIN
ncbi:MAG: hypothetical protein B6I18_01400 [Bacteroidetes bacterium 4572_112]|nr:MAG: hypothetical protein B6I18_01400 [Bacteroidetes bacterium 4572_112]